MIQPPDAGMNGRIVRALRKTHATLPVLVISGWKRPNRVCGLNVTFPDEAAAAG